MAGPGIGSTSSPEPQHDMEACVQNLPSQVVVPAWVELALDLSERNDGAEGGAASSFRIIRVFKARAGHSGADEPIF